MIREQQRSCSCSTDSCFAKLVVLKIFIMSSLFRGFKGPEFWFGIYVKVMIWIPDDPIQSNDMVTCL